MVNNKCLYIFLCRGFCLYLYYKLKNRVHISTTPRNITSAGLIREVYIKKIT